jgi:hypothetical protein
LRYNRYAFSGARIWILPTTHGSASNAGARNVFFRYSRRDFLRY